VGEVGAAVAALAAESAAAAASGAGIAAPSVLVRYFAAAAEAAGREEELLPALASVGQLKSVLVERYGDAMARVLASGSFLVDGVVSREDSRSLGTRVDVLPPFAGG